MVDRDQMVGIWSLMYGVKQSQYNDGTDEQTEQD